MPEYLSYLLLSAETGSNCDNDCLVGEKSEWVLLEFCHLVHFAAAFGGFALVLRQQEAYNFNKRIESLL